MAPTALGAGPPSTARRGAQGSPTASTERGEGQGRLKEHRAIATRYDKTAASVLGAPHLAAGLDWLASAYSALSDSEWDARLS